MRVVEFNELISDPDGPPADPNRPHTLPHTPTVDLHAKLDTRDFVWVVDDASLASEHFVVCQFRELSLRSRVQPFDAPCCHTGIQLLSILHLTWLSRPSFAIFDIRAL